MNRRDVFLVCAMSFAGTLWPSAIAVGQVQNPPLGQSAPETVMVDFENTEISDVIGALARAGQLNVVYSGLPSLPVTLRMSAPVPIAELGAVLRSLVVSNGLEVRDEAGLMHIRAPQTVQNDQDRDSQDVGLHVYRLKHAPAGELASTLQELFGSGPSPAPGQPLASASLTSQLRSQRLSPMDPAAQQQNLGGGVTDARIEGPLQIVADELTNSLLVRAGERDWLVIQQAIDLLDLRPLQVLIEVMIAEVGRGSIDDFGLSVETPPQLHPESGTVLSGGLAGASTGDFVVEILNLGKVKADVVLSALSSRSDIRILSRPVLLAQNNQEAHILVGAERPFVQVFRSLPTDAGVRDQVVQYRDVGTSLRIRPTINLDGYVSLDLLQEVSTATAEVQFGAPVISTREASTRLFLRDGQTAVIGGLVDRQRDHVRTGIPLLKDIPILGALFGSTEIRERETELFLFVTPRIISTDLDVDELREGVETNGDLIRRVLPPRPLLPLRSDTIPGRPPS